MVVQGSVRRNSTSVHNGIHQASAHYLKGGLKNLEKIKGKRDTSSKINAGRKALSDISNFGGNILRNDLQDGARPLKNKNERLSCLHRASVGPGTKTASSSSSKLLMGKVKANQSQAINNDHTQKRVVTKDLKVSADDPTTGVQERASVDITNRTSRRIPLPPTRKSLPVSRQVNQAGGSKLLKENSENNEKGKGKYTFPVKPKVGRNVVSQVSNTRSNFRRNRGSDGFIIGAPKVQSKADIQALSRKPSKPIMKTMVTVSNTRKTSKSKCTSASNVSAYGASSSSKRKEDRVTSSLSEHTASVLPHEPLTQDMLTADSKIILSKSDIASRRKAHRRKSFTSSLILLKQHGEVRGKEILPNIYDNCNHLEVAEYVDDIYQYYWVMEAQNQSLKNYMDFQTQITPQMRGILINWLIEVHLKFDLMQETLFLMVTLLDQYMSMASIKKNEMQLVGLTALLLASKYEDFWHPRVSDLISISAESYTRDEMLGMEKAILKELKFRLNVPTPYVFMLRFVKAAQSDEKFEHLAFYLIELCLVEYEALKFKPSLLCASAIYVARCTLQMTPAWTPLLGKHTHYEDSQIRDSAEMILRFHKAARTAMLKVTYDKYMSLDYSSVAAIKPLDRLPA